MIFAAKVDLNEYLQAIKRSISGDKTRLTTNDEQFYIA